jgi:dihydroorotase
MIMTRLLILNATVINEGALTEKDILIKNGRIEKIDDQLSDQKADVELDAKGNAVFPGMIDDQVHFREPGLTHKGNIYTESRAAVAGGITSYMEMPNTQPPATTQALLEEKFRIANESSFANYSFYLGATNENIEEIKQLDPLKSCGIKAFMGASTGSLLVDDPVALERLFTHAPVLIATHCEDTPTILKNELQYKEEHGNDVPISYHPFIRSTEACYLSSSLAVDLAKKYGAQLHLLHLTTEKEMSLLSSEPVGKKQITAEVCAHHLFFSSDDYEAKGALIKCNPAIKTAKDRNALIQAVIEGKIDMLATDHAPHTLAEKQNSYFKAPSGLPLVQHALQSLLEHYHDERFSLPLIAEKIAHGPAKRFQLKNRGYIREGYWADLVIVDLKRPYEVHENNIFYNCGWSPFEGYEFKSTILTTIVSGHIAYHDGQVDPRPKGMRLAFKR